MQSNAKEFCSAVDRGTDFETFRSTIKAYKPVSVVISSSAGEVKKAYKNMDVLASDALEISNESISTVFRSGFFTAFCSVDFNEGKIVKNKFSTLD